jgi:hypothetical protein
MAAAMFPATVSAFTFTSWSVSVPGTNPIGPITGMMPAAWSAFKASVCNRDGHTDEPELR